MASRRWIWEQYDHLVMGDTMVRPGADSGVVRIRDTERGLAVTVDCTPRYCLADPEIGGAQAVVETWRNITATGATPLAATNNLNFGNPQKPHIMGQIVGCVTGMGAACRALDYPIVSGNVSLYNETEGNAILPTPVIGGVGVIDDVQGLATPGFKAAGETIIVLGQPAERTDGWLGASLYLREIEGREEGAPPPLDLASEKRTGDLVRSLIRDGAVTACHDVSDGGLMVAVAEMALAAGGLGAEVDAPDGPLHAWAFGEDQGRYVVTTTDAGSLLARATEAGVAATAIGTTTQSGELTLNRNTLISVQALRARHEAWLPTYMAAET
jgi:phosphoribosylformylglycinamidine synthase